MAKINPPVSEMWRVEGYADYIERDHVAQESMESVLTALVEGVTKGLEISLAGGTAWASQLRTSHEDAYMIWYWNPPVPAAVINSMRSGDDYTAEIVEFRSENDRWLRTQL